MGISRIAGFVKNGCGVFDEGKHRSSFSPNLLYLVGVDVHERNFRQNGFLFWQAKEICTNSQFCRTRVNNVLILRLL